MPGEIHRKEGAAPKTMPIAVVFGRLAWSPGVFLHLVSVAGKSMSYMETPVDYGDMLAIEAIAARFSVLHLLCD